MVGWLVGTQVHSTSTPRTQTTDPRSRRGQTSGCLMAAVTSKRGEPCFWKTFFGVYLFDWTPQFLVCAFGCPVHSLSLALILFCVARAPPIHPSGVVRDRIWWNDYLASEQRALAPRHTGHLHDRTRLLATRLMIVMMMMMMRWTFGPRTSAF